MSKGSNLKFSKEGDAMLSELAKNNDPSPDELVEMLFNCFDRIDDSGKIICKLRSLKKNDDLKISDLKNLVMNLVTEKNMLEERQKINKPELNELLKRMKKNTLDEYEKQCEIERVQEHKQWLKELENLKRPPNTKNLQIELLKNKK